MAAHARLKNEFTEDEKCHNLWLNFMYIVIRSCSQYLRSIFDFGLCFCRHGMTFGRAIVLISNDGIYENMPKRQPQ